MWWTDRRGITRDHLWRFPYTHSLCCVACEIDLLLCYWRVSLHRIQLFVSSESRSIPVIAVGLFRERAAFNSGMFLMARMNRSGAFAIFQRNDTWSQILLCTGWRWDWLQGGSTDLYLTVRYMFQWIDSICILSQPALNQFLWILLILNWSIFTRIKNKFLVLFHRLVYRVLQVCFDWVLCELKRLYVLSELAFKAFASCYKFHQTISLSTEMALQTTTSVVKSCLWVSTSIGISPRSRYALAFELILERCSLFWESYCRRLSGGVCIGVRHIKFRPYMRRGITYTLIKCEFILSLRNSRSEHRHQSWHTRLFCMSLILSWNISPVYYGESLSLGVQRSLQLIGSDRCDLWI